MTTPPDHPVTGEFHPANRRAEIDSVEAAILAAVDRFGYEEASKFALRVAIEEAIVNAFLHGHRGLPEDLSIDVDFKVDAKSVVIRVTDHGPGFRPDAVPDPTAEENLELPSGRGLMLIRAYMSRVTHDLDGRRIAMVYERPSAESVGP